jgi:LacI family transcriptional regulator
MAKEIALLLDYNDNYAKTVVDGVAKYSMQSNWRFFTHRGVPSITSGQLQAWQGDGVIGYLTPAIVQMLDQRGIPAVNVKTDFPELPACSVLTDNREIGRRAANYLAGKGFRRFAYTAGPVEGICGELKFNGFSGLLAELGFTCRRFKAKEDLRPVFDEDPKLPLAVLAAEDFVGRMVIEACEDSGLRVPEDIAVLGVNNSPFICCMVKPQLSSIELGAERIGYQAAALLARLMQGMPPPREPIVIAPEDVVERHSTELVEMEDRLIPDALRFIEQHIQEPIQVADVARAVCCGRRTLEKRFSQLLERSPHEEIRRMRIRRACELLRETDTIIEVLAGSCGYSARDRFNAAFKKEMNMTPSQYRKQYRFAKHSL